MFRDDTGSGLEPQDTTPARLGGYRIESSLGQGGMGEVFLAWDERLQRHVAIKRILGEKSLDTRHHARFRREAQAVARLNHPAIVQIFDILDTGDGEGIVMEYVEGTNLAQLIAAGEVDLRQTLELAREIADGLAEAHGKGLVHRDLKPANVIVTPAGHAKILDFGLVRTLPLDPADPHAAATVHETLTESGALVGTVHAMSPEQASGRQVDHRSDLFALGGLLYEMLSGQAPFRGENLLDTLWRVTNEEPEPLGDLAPGVPAELIALVDRLLAKDPVDRPADAREVSDALSAILSVELSGVVGSATASPLSIPATTGISPGDGPQPVIRALLMTELVHATRRKESLEDSRALELASRHDRMARDLLAGSGGLEIGKRDGILALFERPSDAVAYALEYHGRLDRLAGELALPVSARIGIHLGEVFLRRNPSSDVARGAKPWEVDGLARSIVARLVTLAEARQTLLTHGAFDLARKAAHQLPEHELQWLAHGSYVLDNMDEPVEVFEIGVEGRAPLREPADSPSARRVLAHGEEATLGWRPAAGQTIPFRAHWQLVERVGEGGFGEVWLARHKSGEERIFKFCFEASRLRGLKREVTLFRLLKEALGHRDDITRILDWNFDEAPYFLESEYTESGNLVEWAEKQGGLAEVPLSTRLELIAQVAEALAAAHSVGILHKDVKPENVLVRESRDRPPRAQLTDFGIGLLTDRGILNGAVTAQGFTETVHGGEASTGGTVRFMAPELLEGRPATVQADVYSLGVMLYQAVIGDFSRALAPGWRRDVADELLAEDLAAFVDGSPDRRPASALTVARRLRSLEARREERAEERRRRQAEEDARLELERARRRRKVALVVAAAALLVVCLVSVLAFQAVDARREAEQRRAQAEDLIGFMLGDLRDKLETVGRLEILDDVGDKALDYFGAAPGDRLSDTEAWRRAQALVQIGRVRLAEGRPGAARELFDASRAEMGSLLERQPDHLAWQQELANVHFWTGKILWDQRDLDGALEQFESQRRLAETIAAGDPGNLELEQNLGYALSNLAFIQKERGDLAGALEAFQATLEIKRRLADADPDAADPQRYLADQYNLVGETRLRLGDLAQAGRNFQAGLDLVDAWLAREPENTQWRVQAMRSHYYLGRWSEALGDPGGARPHLDAHLAIARTLSDLDPAHKGWRNHLALASLRLARHLIEKDRPGEATPHLQRSLDLGRSLVDQDPSQARWQLTLARARLASAEEHLARNDARGARELVTAVRGSLESTLEADAQNGAARRWLAHAEFLDGRALTRLGDTVESGNAYERALTTFEPLTRDSSDPELLSHYLLILTSCNRDAEAAEVERTLQNLRSGAR